jgi:hypothetical protein
MSTNSEKLLTAIANVDEKELVAYIGVQKEDVDIPFGLVFVQSLQTLIATKKITLTDVSVFLEIFSLAEYGNLVKFSQKYLADKLKIQQSMVSRSLKKLTDVAILISVDSGMYINPFIVSKGRLTKLDKRVLEIALEHQDTIPCPFPKLRRVDKTNKKGED